MHKLWLPSFILLSNPTTRGGSAYQYTLWVSHPEFPVVNMEFKLHSTLLLAQHSAHFRFCYVNDSLTSLALQAFLMPTLPVLVTIFQRSTAVDPPNSTILRAIHCLTLEPARTINETASELGTVVSQLHVQVDRGLVNTCTCLPAWQ